MRVFFFAPFKAISSPIPSGDREIGRGLFSFLSAQKEEVKVLSNFHSLLFWFHIWGVLLYFPFLIVAFFRVLLWRPDYFFTYHLYYKAPDPFAFWLASIFNKPHFIFEGMYSLKPRDSWKTWPGWFLTKLAIERASHVFTDKTDDIESLERILAKEKITYIPPSIDTAFFCRDGKVRNEIRTKFNSDDLPIIIGVAMLRPDRKSEGVEFLLHCLAELKEEGLNFLYLHVGDGDMLSSLTSLAEKIIPGRAKFLGRMDKEKVRDYLSAADLFAFPGLDEAFGMVYVEAQSCNLPVVAFKNGGIPDAVSADVSGFLTPLLDKAEMKKALRKLLTDSSLRQKMGNSARNFVLEKFDKEKNYKKMFEIIRASTKKEPSR